MNDKITSDLCLMTEKLKEYVEKSRAASFSYVEARAGTIFSDIALTYRKYRVGLNAVTPRPSKINFDVFAELWTKIIMKTELSQDRRI